MYQRIGHATSDDMHNWTRVGDGLCLDITGENAKYYELTHGRFLARPCNARSVGHAGSRRRGVVDAFTARAPNIAEANAGGAIDLQHPRIW